MLDHPGHCSLEKDPWWLMFWWPDCRWGCQNISHQQSFSRLYSDLDNLPSLTCNLFLHDILQHDIRQLQYLHRNMQCTRGCLYTTLYISLGKYKLLKRTLCVLNTEKKNINWLFTMKNWLFKQDKQDFVGKELD